MLTVGEIGGRAYGNSILSLQLFYKPKIFLIKNIYIKYMYVKATVAHSKEKMGNFSGKWILILKVTK